MQCHASPGGYHHRGRMADWPEVLLSTTPPSQPSPSLVALLFLGLMYDYVPKHKAYAKATRTTTTRTGRSWAPGILGLVPESRNHGNTTMAPFICIAKFAHVQIEIYDAE